MQDGGDNFSLKPSPTTRGIPVGEQIIEGLVLPVSKIKKFIAIRLRIFFYFTAFYNKILIL